jgi:hypothetical protein
MAAKKSNAGQVLTIGAVLVVVYFAYKLLFAPKVGAATAPGVVGGGYAGYNPYAPPPVYGTPTAASSGNSTLASLLNQLLGKPSASGKASGGGAAQPSGNSGPVPSGVNNNFQLLADFVNQGNYDWQNYGAENAFAASDVAGLFTPQIPVPDYTPQTLDVSQFAQDFNPYQGVGIDTSSLDTGPLDLSIFGGGDVPDVQYSGD